MQSPTQATVGDFFFADQLPTIVENTWQPTKEPAELVTYLHLSVNGFEDAMSDYTNIGKIVASSGLAGEVILKHALGKKTSLKPVETIFIELHKGALIPYFIESSKAKSPEELVIKLEGVAHKEAAAMLIKKNIWLLKEDFRKLVDPSSPLSLLGFSLINEGENLGAIEEVIEQPQQILLRLVIQNREVLIPLHEKTLQKIDHRSKKVFVVLPDGLLDIYLGI